MAINVWTFTGNLGKDGEQRFTTNGGSVVSFSVAVKSGYGDKTATTWARCSLFGKQGEAVFPYLKKGQLVGISGEARMNEYTNKEGVKQTSLEVNVRDLTLLGKREESDAPKPQQRNSQAAPPASGMGDFEDDIPFDQPYRKSWRIV